MLTPNPQDEQELDMDIDPEEAEELPEEGTIIGAQPTPEIDPEIEQEIKRVMIEEEPAKAKPQLLPDQLIHKELQPDDLFDAGSI